MSLATTHYFINFYFFVLVFNNLSESFTNILQLQKKHKNLYIIIIHHLKLIFCKSFILNTIFTCRNYFFLLK